MNKEFTNKILEINDLSVGYRFPILEYVNTSIKNNEIILLAGENGSGKTTLLKTIYKELNPVSGNIFLNNKNLKDFENNEIGRNISVVLSKNTILPSLRVYDLLAFGRYPYKKWYSTILENYEKKLINDTLEELKLEEYRNTQINQLSEGNLQKVLIARAIVQDCSFIILDEPTSHLDISNKLLITNILKKLAKEKNKSILFTSHDLDLGISISDKLWLIKEKTLVTGFTEDLGGKEDLFNYFTKNNKELSFNYKNKQFDIHDKQNHIGISIQENNSESAFWLKKSLYRNHYIEKENSEIKIKIIENTNKNDTVNYIIKISDQEFSCNTIEEVINTLNKESKK